MTRFRHLTLFAVLTLIFLGCGDRDRVTDPGPGPDPDSGGIPAAEQAGIQSAFSAGDLSREFATEAVEAVAFWVFAASFQNNNTVTINGTLTQTAEGSDEFTWVNTPGDRLLVDLTVNGSPVRFEVTVSAFEGDLSSDSDNFKDFHSNFAFRIVRQGQFDATVASQSGTPGRPARTSGRLGEQREATSPAAGTVAFVRSLTGTRVFGGITYTANLTVQGTSFFEVDGQFAELDRRDGITGTLTAAGIALQISETSRGHILSNAGEGRTVANHFRNADNQISVNGVSYEMSQVAIQTETVNGKISEPDFWNASGTLRRGGAAIGALRFRSPPALGGDHPGLIWDLGEGQSIPL
ncbi:MAG: hypothetical protein IT349_10425 [Candidatus Eisenbacteria bacterium]|nr:hypothetical protein [Candidatus Eisenbacteria bacterium]